MATDAGGTRPLTQNVATNGQSAVDYTLPAGLFQYIQSVVATVDTSASGDVTPLLTVRDDAGLVIADKQQGQSIDAGGEGRATWALRLTDEHADPAPAIAAQREIIQGDPVTVASLSTSRLTWDFVLEGPDVLDITTDPTQAFVLKTGTYGLTVYAAPDENLTVGARWDLLLRAVIPAAVNPEIHQLSGTAGAGAPTSTQPGVVITLPYRLPVGTALQLEGNNLDSVSRKLRLLQAIIQRLA